MDPPGRLILETRNDFPQPNLYYRALARVHYLAGYLELGSYTNVIFGVSPNSGFPWLSNVPSPSRFVVEQTLSSLSRLIASSSGSLFTATSGVRLRTLLRTRIASPPFMSRES